MAGPSIKSAVVSGLVDDVAALRESGRIPAEEIEARLEAEDFALLEEKTALTDWVPIASYTRLTELLWEIEGHRSVTYLERRGRTSARRFLDAARYQQVDYLKERYDAGDLERARASLKLVVTLQGSLINFGTWAVETDPDFDDRLVIRITDAHDYPDVLLHAMTGFITEMAHLRDDQTRWSFERPGTGVVLFRTDRAFAKVDR